MTNKTHVLDHPMLIFGGFTTSGSTADLKAGIISTFDAKTGKAVTTLSKHRPVRLAQGSYHTKDSLGSFLSGLKKSTKTADFLPEDVMHIEFSPYVKPQNEKWILGWDGVTDCESLTFKCGTTHKFRFRVFGQGVYNDSGKQILRDVSVTTACCDSTECELGCPDDKVHCRKYTKMLVDAINKDVELSKYLKAEVVLPEIKAKTFTHKLMCLSLCDNGDQEALNVIQRQYPDVTMTRTDRKGSISTYSTDCILNAKVLADFKPEGEVLLAACGTCPTDFTLVPAAYRYIVTQPIDGDDNLATDAAKLAFATAVAGAYAGTKPLFLSSNVAGATVQFEATSATLTALFADVILSVEKVEAKCVPTAAAAPIAWVKCGDRYVATQKKCLILAKDCGKADRLADLVAYYAANTNIVAGSIKLKTAGECEDEYTIEQYSGCLEDGCLTEPNPVFPDIPAFENKLWGVCKCEVEAEATEANKCGIRIEVSSNYDTFGECSWTPEDYYTFLPTSVQLWEVTEDGEPCGDFIGARKIQNAIQPNQSGQWAKREYLKLAAYTYGSSFDNDPRSREIFDQNVHNAIDIKGWYNVIYFKYRQYRNGSYKIGQDAEIFEIPIIIKSTVDPTAFINYLNTVYSQVGVSVTKRVGQADY